MSALGRGLRLCPPVSTEFFRWVAPVGRLPGTPVALSASVSGPRVPCVPLPANPSLRLQEAGDAGPAVTVGHDAARERAHRLPLPAHHPQHAGTAGACGPRSGGGRAWRAGTRAEHPPPSTWGPSACAPALCLGWVTLEVVGSVRAPSPDSTGVSVGPRGGHVLLGVPGLGGQPPGILSFRTALAWAAGGYWCHLQGPPVQEWSGL